MSVGGESAKKTKERKKRQEDVHAILIRAASKDSLMRRHLSRNLNEGLIHAD